MTRKIICDDSDRTLWLKERRKLITASDLSVFIGTAPSFYSQTKEELIEAKQYGLETELPENRRRAATHGQLREAGNMELLSQLLGFPIVPYHYLISNDRWPYLGATLDGILFPWMEVEPRLDLTSDPVHAMNVRGTLMSLREPVLVEMKNTNRGHLFKDKEGPTQGLKAWVNYSPHYHQEQVQTGLHMAELEHGILCGSLGADDMIPWLHAKDPEWAGVLDSANSEAFEVLK